LFPKPYQDLGRTRIDLSHQLNLLALFSTILLVDADSVDPKPSRFLFASEAHESRKEIVSNEKSRLVEADLLVHGFISPDIR
jgi:hypothetical protein